ncbi:cysteinyl-tRNA synthetase/mycothiol ligase [Kipferlia bialata]|uniref:cysteine--tRNA ligase n=1 Tax=Kipferlia bialata TaxID=797122 RepID=A0A9K3CVE7_9EUKA|nr:cysteinyl-tRNA synthetase/mycothiol ligase [Kipferlia bialata]|eukprot:g4667.t1
MSESWSEPAGFRTGINVSNSLLKKKCELVTQEENKVKWYICGPTVYDCSHMGHARTYVAFDTVRRIMEAWFGLDVDYIMNITDVDDKIIKRSAERGFGTEIAKISEKYEAEFLADMRSLGVKDATHVPRVTTHMDAIITFIQTIIDNGFGYAAPSGSVYFNIKAFLEAGHTYPKLRPDGINDQAALQEGEGALTSEAAASEKLHDNDFVLWKASKPDEPVWQSPWGEGRPGWHIECSAISHCIAGKVLDIHTGGIDLQFPHHDNEIAQSEAHSLVGQAVNYFMHAGMVLVSHSY